MCQVRVSSFVLPESPDDALAALMILYERRADHVISKAFAQFEAVLGSNEPNLVYAYLSEINLAMRNEPFSPERVRTAIEFLKSAKPEETADSLYCQANGYSALGDRELAKRLLREAIRINGGRVALLEAQCWKNLGTELEREGNHAEARQCFKKAIEVTPDLMEAHFALEMSHVETGALLEALNHFDQVIWAVEDVVATLAVRGRRLEVFFRLRMTEKAFDEIAVILPHSDRFPWIAPWCARLVYEYARSNDESIVKAIRFWTAFLRRQPLDRVARKEWLLCLAHAKMHDHDAGIDFQEFLGLVSAFVATDSDSAAHLWDRVGHWAQVDGDWAQAEAAYRKAYALEPERYGYCLGTALNSLDRFDEALPILLEQATIHQPDALSWFQVARAQEGLAQIEAAKNSYARALDLDPDYDAAMFNLGGIYWNYGSKMKAVQIWKVAIERFPSHPMSVTLRRDFSAIFKSGDGNAVSG